MSTTQYSASSILGCHHQTQSQPVQYTQLKSQLCGQKHTGYSDANKEDRKTTQLGAPAAAAATTTTTTITTTLQYTTRPPPPPPPPPCYYYAVTLASSIFKHVCTDADENK